MTTTPVPVQQQHAAVPYLARIPMQIHRIVLCLLALSATWDFTVHGAPPVEKPQPGVVWTAGQNGYSSYRIPALIVTRKGTLLAFCEGRRNSASDAGDIDLLMKRSRDGGRTWSEQQVVWDDGENTCGNPCPVVDPQTGAILLLLTHNLGKDHERGIIAHKAKSTRTVWISRSTDDGMTFSAPADITASTKKPEWGWYATGPGIGIAVEQGPHRGRLVIPCDHSYDDPEGRVAGGPYEFGSHVIYSDDHGETWRIGGIVRPKMNECQVVELAEPAGELLINMRSYRGKQCRAEARSRDGGQTWSAPADVPALIEPVCQASLVRCLSVGDKATPRLLFSNPADKKARVDLRVRVSDDNARTWSAGRSLHAGPAAYSCLTALPDGDVGCLFEAGEKNAYETLTFVRFSQDWVKADAK